MRTFSKIPGDSEKSRLIKCPVCGGKQFRRKWEIEGASFVSCSDCRLILQNPQPFPTDLKARYDSEYFDYEMQNEESFFKLMMLGLKDADFFEKIVPTLPDKRNILDIGCATGRLLKHFKLAGWETAGVEPCVESVDFGNREYGVNIRAVTLENAEFSDSEFSFVHASHLIEHVSDPSAFVAEVVRVLLPGGVFVCVTPSFDGFQARLHGSSWRSAIPDHVTLFSKSTLTQLLKNSGLEVELVRTWGGLAVGSVPGWIKKIADVLAKKWNFGDVVLVLARKPL
ncbi:MAG: class I SAM-dependent methyltransferase [Spirochaetes bacterium]|nr:MAG: class I SAM-dependent methyltransferase [Spirochaetota bacterium]RKX99042.1 MAG: class I SAM-dependent methyltransferase [Spirochaetota bacterium]